MLIEIDREIEVRSNVHILLNKFITYVIVQSIIIYTSFLPAIVNKMPLWQRAGKESLPFRPRMSLKATKGDKAELSAAKLVHPSDFSDEGC